MIIFYLTYLLFFINILLFHPLSYLFRVGHPNSLLSQSSISHILFIYFRPPQIILSYIHLFFGFLPLFPLTYIPFTASVFSLLKTCLSPLNLFSLIFTIGTTPYYFFFIIFLFCPL